MLCSGIFRVKCLEIKTTPKAFLDLKTTISTCLIIILNYFISWQYLLHRMKIYDADIFWVFSLSINGRRINVTLNKWKSIIVVQTDEI